MSDTQTGFKLGVPRHAVHRFLARSGPLLWVGSLLASVGLLLVSAEEPATVDEAVAKNYAPPNREVFRQGRFVYQKNCMVCHGRFGEGDGELVKDWEVRPRDFTKGVFKYRSTPYGKLPTDDDLKRTIRQGVSGSAMPVFHELQDGEIVAVIEYVKFFSPAWKDESNYAESIELPPAPKWFSDGAELRTQADLGRAMFGETCAPCHGTGGAGDGVAAAELRDGAGKPVRPADLRLPLGGGPLPEDVYRTIMTGISGTPMTGFDGAIAPPEAWQIVAYVFELQSAGLDSGAGN
jgi:cytochrome c oxidase cbb3-type subunit 2